MPSHDSDNPGNDIYVAEDLVPAPTWAIDSTFTDVGGTDTIVYSDPYANGVYIYLAAGDGTNAPWRAESFRRVPNGSGGLSEVFLYINGQVENAIGGVAGDSITGNSIANVLQGDADDVAGGNDNLTGLIGNDTLIGMGGSDVLWGNANFNDFGINDDDLLIGDSDPYAQQSVNIASGDDTLYGNAGNDTLYAGPGNNHLDGGDGFDTADYGRHVPDDSSSYSVRTVLDLGAGTAQVIGTDFYDGTDFVIANDTITGIERVLGGAGDDSLAGDDLSNWLYGSYGSDVLRGEGGSDQLFGETGNDSVSGGDGTDDISGGGGNDTLKGDGGEDSLNGGDDNDRLAGGDGNDTLDGGNGVDTIIGGDGNDSLYGGGTGTDESVLGGNGHDRVYSTGSGYYGGDAGNDTLYAADSTILPEILDGGTGTDTIDTTGTTAAYRLDLAAGTTGNPLKTFTNFENASTGIGADRILGTGGSNVISGGDGNDTINGLAGNDTVRGGTGADKLAGGDGFDMVSYVYSSIGVAVSLETGAASSGDASGDTITAFEGIEGSGFSDTLTGSASADLIKGFGGSDSMDGGAGSDTVIGSWSNDTIHGGDGNDTISGNGGTNQLFGDGGVDTADYGAFDVLNPFLINVHLELSLTTRTATVTGYDIDLPGQPPVTIASDSLDGIENAVGTPGSDSITGDTNDNRLEGGDGNDTLRGGAGNDMLRGGTGDDSMAGAAGDDIYYVDSVNDQTVESTDRGTDTVYSTIDWTLANSVEVLRLQGQAGLAGTGNNADNKLFGNTGANLLRGLNGNDALNGGTGDDTLEGGGGNDTLIGGAGADIVRLAQSNAGADSVRDFNAGDDRFDLFGGTFSAMSVAGSDTILTHAGGTVRVEGISNLSLDDWKALVLGGNVLPASFGTGASSQPFGLHPHLDPSDWLLV